MIRDNEFDTRYDGRSSSLPPPWVFFILGIFVLLYTGYNLVSKTISKDFEQFTIIKEGMCNLRTADAAHFAIRWEVEFKLNDRELYDLYGEDFEAKLVDLINFDIRKYYFDNKIFDTLLIHNLYKDSREIRNIPQKLKIDTTSFYKYIPNPSLVTKRLVLQKFRIIDPGYDYNIGLYIKPINMVFLQHNQPIVFSAQVSNMFQRTAMEKQKLIQAKQELIEAKEYLEKVKAEKEAELILQDAMSHADKMRKDAELRVKRAIAAQAKHDEELINKTRKHILDSINNN